MDDPLTRPGPCIAVPPRTTAAALARLGEAGLLDHRRKVTRQDGRVLIPTTGAPGELETGWEATQAILAPNPKLPPADELAWRLEDALSPEQLETLPTGWLVLGDVCLVGLDEVLAPQAERIGAVLGQVLGVDSVLEDRGCHGELREPDTRLLWGEPDTTTVHREHGLVFHLDPARVMFSAGNHTERHRLVDQITPGERVVDLFAGIGYFTLPLARAGASVVACEKNPVSAAFLRENVAANGLTDSVEVREGDCREIAPAGTADRVLLGYFPGTRAFLACALRALNEGGGVLHYHTTASEPDALGLAQREFAEGLADHLAPQLPDNLTDSPPKAGTHHHVHQARRVKSYAPGVSHVVLDVEVGR